MIVEPIVTVFTAFVKFVLGALPTSGPPSWVTSGSGALASLWSYGAGLGAWIPWATVGTVVGTVVACVGIGLVIKIARIVASFFTFGGGSAA